MLHVRQRLVIPLLAILLLMMGYIVYRDQAVGTDDTGGWQATQARIAIPLDDELLTKLQKTHPHLALEGLDGNEAVAVVWSVQPGGILVEEWMGLDATVYKAMQIRWPDRTIEQVPVNIDTTVIPQH